MKNKKAAVSQRQPLHSNHFLRQGKIPMNLKQIVLSNNLFKKNLHLIVYFNFGCFIKAINIVVFFEVVRCPKIGL